MFFLHALETKRKQLVEANDVTSLHALPQVTVFEKSSTPGGVWKSRAADDVKNATNMYEGLWTNGPKFAFEFFDYTFEEHFNKTPQTVYMPRKKILDYIMKRVNNNNMYNNYYNNNNNLQQQQENYYNVQFNTEVLSVTYNETISKFVVIIKSSSDEEIQTTTQTHLFDKCIWASGLNGKPNMVPEITEKILLSNYQGTIIHSSQVDNLDNDDDKNDANDGNGGGGSHNSVKGKRILLVGGNLSAEDLALSFIKMGAATIYITTRDMWKDIVHFTTSWPANKVKILKYRVPCGSGVGDGNGNDDGGNTNNKTIRVCQHNPDGTNESIYEDIPDIDIVVLCTGYESSMDYLDRTLVPCWITETCDTYQIKEGDFGSTTENSSLLGGLIDVEPSKELELYDVYLDRVLISNPKMFYIHESEDVPLLEIDIAAWQVLTFLIDNSTLPSSEQMKEEMRLNLLEQMQHHTRYEWDEEYWYALGMAEFEGRLSPERFRSKSRYELGSKHAWVYYTRRIVRSMQRAKYPISFGTFGNLNELGEKFLQVTFQAQMDRSSLEHVPEQDKIWMTFRDVDVTNYTSIYTGMKAVPIQGGRWMDVDDEGNLVVDVVNVAANGVDNDSNKDTNDDGIFDCNMIAE